MEEDVGLNWFNSKVVRRVDNDLDTNFLNVVWRREMTLHAKYPRLYSISNQQETLGEIDEGGE